MIQKCEKCGGELMDGALTTMYGIYFYPETQSKFKFKRSTVECSCCKNCGQIRDIRVKDIDKIR